MLAVCWSRIPTILGGLLRVSALLVVFGTCGSIAFTAESLAMSEKEIPVVRDPAFIPPSQATFLEDDDLVLGVLSGGEAKAYPIRILGLYEVINDHVGDQAISATW